jgi:hypothetical protein
VSTFYEYGNEPSGFTECYEFFNYVSESKLFKKGSAPNQQQRHPIKKESRDTDSGI